MYSRNAGNTVVISDSEEKLQNLMNTVVMKSLLTWAASHLMEDVQKRSSDTMELKNLQEHGVLAAQTVNLPTRLRLLCSYVWSMLCMDWHAGL